MPEAARRTVVIIGAGVAGSALAAELSATPDIAVTLIERGLSGLLPGSTGHAPGFVGLLNEVAHLTELARQSADLYERLEHHDRPGFDRVGGLEVAGSTAAVHQLERRAELAAEAGLPAQLLTPTQAADAAPELVDPRTCRAGLLFPDDGTARARTVTAALVHRARAGGARFLYGTTVTGLDISGGRIDGVRTADGQELPADDVVLAAGIWGPHVAALAGQRLPLTAVAHPYVHGPSRPSRSGPSPFVRWPEHHVYARDHGDRLGLGTYDHTPVAVPSAELEDSAERSWLPAFESAIQQALDLLPGTTRFDVETRLNGVFSMTADNQPLVGLLPQIKGLWSAEALWVTHAAGAAALLARQMTGTSTEHDKQALQALRPDRFDDQPDLTGRHFGSTATSTPPSTTPDLPTGPLPDQLTGKITGRSRRGSALPHPRQLQVHLNGGLPMRNHGLPTGRSASGTF